MHRYLSDSVNDILIKVFSGETKRLIRVDAYSAVGANREGTLQYRRRFLFLIVLCQQFFLLYKKVLFILFICIFSSLFSMQIHCVSIYHDIYIYIKVSGLVFNGIPEYANECVSVSCTFSWTLFLLSGYSV